MHAHQLHILNFTISYGSNLASQFSSTHLMPQAFQQKFYRFTDIISITFHPHILLMSLQ